MCFKGCVFMRVKNVTSSGLRIMLGALAAKTPSAIPLIKAGTGNDIKKFGEKLCKYNWQRAGDVAMAVIMVTIVIAASKADDITVSANARDD